MPADTLTLQPGELLKRVERALSKVPQDEAVEPTLIHLVEAVIASLGTELGLSGGRVYRREAGGYRLVSAFGAASMPDDAVVLRLDYPPVEECLREGIICFAADDPRLARELEDRIEVSGFAAIAVDHERYLLSFDLMEENDRDSVLLILGIVRHGIVQRIRQERVHDVYREARRIQASILPRRTPKFADFDIAGRNDPMETVGGDYFDFIQVSPKILGLAIADVTGHGLPAALQVRDVYIGLRMGLGRDFKIVSTVERLARLIHESTLSSRFVSMVYGELEINGNFLYVNAGHPPPFRLSGEGEISLLEAGGVVMGPLPEASYERGFVRLSPGDLVVFYTDGIVEASCDDATAPEEFGLERLIELVRRERHRSAAEIIERIFLALDLHCHGVRAGDDRTVMVVRYPD